MNKYIPLPENMTIGECYAPAMAMTDSEDAQAYLDALIERSMRCHGKSEEEARRIQLSNIGYYAGYYDSETRQRMQMLFGAIHPILGSASLTPEQLLKKGYDLAKGETE